MAKETEAAIAELHAWYCERTGLQTKLFFSQRLWYDMAKAYDFDFSRLRTDAELIIRYLKRELARDKRNVGALKLQNFLQPDNFDADLAVAKLTMKSSKHQAPSTRESPNTKLPEGEWRGPETAEKMRAFRKSLGRGSS